MVEWNKTLTLTLTLTRWSSGIRSSLKACSNTHPHPNTNTNTNPNSSKACRNTNPNPNSFEGMQHHYAASAHEEAHEYGKQVS